MEPELLARLVEQFISGTTASLWKMLLFAAAGDILAPLGIIA
jgi:hypothetical protein